MKNALRIATIGLFMTAGTALAHGGGASMGGGMGAAMSGGMGASAAHGTSGAAGTMGVPVQHTMSPSGTMQAGTTHTPLATGQPNQTCGSATAPNTPGNAASAPGSAFNPDGTAGTQYAGQQPQNSGNPAAVSQYDVACFHQP